MKRVRVPWIILLTVCGWSFAAPTAEAGVVKVEFAATVRAPEECPSPRWLPDPKGMRQPSLASRIAPAGSLIAGTFEYDTDAVIDKENNPQIADRFSAPPNWFRLALSVAGKKATLSEPPKAGYLITASLLRSAPGQRWLDFGASIKPDPEVWGEEVDSVSWSLNLHPRDDDGRLAGLPSAERLSSLSISGLSRLTIYGDRSADTEPARPLWIICAELASLVASDQSPK